MPEITTAFILTKLGEGALSKAGGKILESVLPGVFGNSEDFDELKAGLKELSQKLDDVLFIARNTFELVQSLPDVVVAIVDEQTLYLAKTNIESSMRVYVALDISPNIISQGELTKLTQSITIIFDKENKTDVIAKIPSFCEYLLAATSGKMYEFVHSGVVSKLNKVRQSKEQVGIALETVAREAEAIIASEYVASGSLFDQGPWLSWSGAPDRFVSEQICIPRCTPPSMNGDCWEDCHTHTSPNTAWNNARNSRLARLGTLRTEIARLSKLYMSLAVSERVLSTYKESLEARKGAILAKQAGFYALESSTFPFEHREGFSLAHA